MVVENRLELLMELNSDLHLLTPEEVKEKFKIFALDYPVKVKKEKEYCHSIFSPDTKFKKEIEDRLTKIELKVVIQDELLRLMEEKIKYLIVCKSKRN